MAYGLPVHRDRHKEFPAALAERASPSVRRHQLLQPIPLPLQNRKRLPARKERTRYWRCRELQDSWSRARQ
jgi:hypothetical protein